VGLLGAGTVEAISQAIHRRAINNRADRGSATAVFVCRSGQVFAFDLDSLTANLWMRDRIDLLLAVIDPSRPDYSANWLESTLRDQLGETK